MKSTGRGTQTPTGLTQERYPYVEMMRARDAQANLPALRFRTVVVYCCFWDRREGTTHNLMSESAMTR